MQKAEELLSNSQLEESLVYCEKIIKIDDTADKAFFVKGHSLYALSRYEEAISAYKRASELDPGEADYHARMGYILYLYLNRYEEAISAYKRASELNLGEADYHARMGDILYLCLNRYEEALEAYKRASELDPDETGYYSRMGYILYLYLNRYEEALEAYKRANELKPNEAVYYENQAKVHEKWAQDLRDKAAKLKQE